MSILVQCPRCNGAVSIADRAAGKRVKCPHCAEAFLAPGISALEKVEDEDDWLSLDEKPLQSTPATPPTETASPVGNGISDEDDILGEFALPPLTTPQPKRLPNRGLPSLSKEEEALLARFAGETDDFAAETKLPPKSQSAPTGTSMPVPLGASKTNSPAPKPATPTEYASEYRVKCKICGTYLYAKAHQAGSNLKCSDCHSPVTVPPPPKVTEGVKINMANAETFQFAESAASKRGPDPFKRSADELLEEASREEEVNGGPTYEDVPSVKEWFLNVFGIFRDLGVVAHWLGLSAFAAIPAALVLHSEQQILILGLFPAGFFLGVLVVSCGFAIMHAVANEEESVREWPTLDPFAWLGQLAIVVAAASLCVIPIWTACMLVGLPTLLSLFFTMIVVYATFPFVFLSMLDMNSFMMPFSVELARSATQSSEAWGGFYFSSGLLFGGLFLLLTVTSAFGVTAATMIGVTAAIGVAFAYFSMVGRLAFAIGQSVNAPPRVDDVDRSRHNNVS